MAVTERLGERNTELETGNSRYMLVTAVTEWLRVEYRALCIVHARYHATRLNVLEYFKHNFLFRYRIDEIQVALES